MKTKLLSVIVLLLLMSTQIFAQQYPEVSIYDIQYQDPATLNTYFQDDNPSPYDGDTVTVTGMVMVPPYKTANPDSGVIMYVGGGDAGFYMQDTSASADAWSGILVLIEEAANYPAFQILDSGTVVKVTGVVTEYATSTQKTTELILIGFDGSEVLGFQEKNDPVVLTLDSLKQIGTTNEKAISEKWEGMYIEIRDVSTFNADPGSGRFSIVDANNTQLNIGTKSNYFYQWDPPSDGTVLEYIRGYIETRSTTSGGLNLNPGFREDVKISQLPPNISGITRFPQVVGYNESVNVTAIIVDPDGSLTDVKLIYREDMGSSNEITMTNIGGDTFQATIPGQADSSLVDYFIRAEDNQGNVGLNPADTSNNRYFYLVLDRPLTVQDVQYSPFGGGISGYDSYNVTVRGIVVADTTDIEGDGGNTGPQVILQNGSGPWSAIRLRGTAILDRRRGDDISVTGTVDELFSQTLIDDIDNAGQITIHSTGNTLPDPVHVSTQTIDRLSNGSVQAEQWESVLMQYRNITVTDENADGNPGPGGGGNSNFGEMLVADSTGIETRIELQDGTHSYNNFWDPSHENDPFRIKQTDQFDYMTGILFYSFGNYKLIPRKDDDFGPNTVSVNEDGLTPYEYALAQNYPNPFNPSTKINYSLADAGNVTIKVFNILGQEIVTLIDGFKEAGKHSVSFDASSLSSGIYLYKINADNFTSTKKMILLR